MDACEGNRRHLGGLLSINEFSRRGEISRTQKAMKETLHRPNFRWKGFPFLGGVPVQPIIKESLRLKHEKYAKTIGGRATNRTGQGNQLRARDNM
jgi:hypothetical protein